MLDQSSSMSDSLAGGQATRWTAVGSGIEGFLAQPGSASFGLQYFGLAQSCPLTCNVDADCGGCGPCQTGFCLGGGDSCAPADYATPNVEIGPVQSVATNVMASLATHSPDTGSPTSAALQGAVDHAGTYAGAHAEADVVALLITDGDPDECDVNAGDINTIASTALDGAERHPHGRHFPRRFATVRRRDRAGGRHRQRRRAHDRLGHLSGDHRRGNRTLRPAHPGERRSDHPASSDRRPGHNRAARKRRLRGSLQRRARVLR